MNAPPPGWPQLRAEALSLIEGAQGRGAVLRLVGSAAVRLHCAGAESLMAQFPRAPKDLDFVCRARDRNSLRALFTERGYETDRDMLVAMEGKRYGFSNPKVGFKIDVFVDQLEFCHTIDLRDRLEPGGLTIGLEDLLLHKLQIVELTAGDLMDLGALLHLHPLAGESPSASGDAAPIETGTVADVLRDDWGFHHTAMRNLQRVSAHAAEGGYAPLAEGAGLRIAARADGLREAVERVPKSLRWKLRAKIGERLQWWQDVDQREGTY